jgi:RNA polymerase sigma factor (sigma-70 family)
MDDQNNVAATVADNIEDLLAAFDRYAGELYAYCQSRLTEPADATAAVQDTFVVASAKVSELQDPTLLRAWLFAVARNECHRRLRSATPSAPLYEAAEAMNNTAQFSALAVQPAVSDQKELRALVRAALAELDPEDREVSELNLRYGLSRSELGAVLGVPRNQAQALAARASTRFERSLGLALVTSPERQYCPELAAIMDGSARRSAVLLRRKVRRHSQRCAVCSKRRDLGPAKLLSMLTVPDLPVGLWRRIFDLITDPSADASAYRAQVANQAEPFGVSGFPIQLAPASSTRGRSILVLAAVLGAVALALLAGGTYFVEYTSNSGPTAPSPSATASTATSAAAAVPSTHPNARASSSTPSATALIQPAAPGQSVAPTKVIHTSAAPTKKASPKPTSTPTSPTPTPTSPTPTPTSPTPTPTSPTPTPTSTASPTSGTSSSAPSTGISSAVSIALTLPGITSGLVSVG